MKGTRITVDYILEALANGWSFEEVAENYRIPAVYEALRYASKAIKKVEVIAFEGTG